MSSTSAHRQLVSPVDHHSRALLGLSFGALGVIYGDIGAFLEAQVPAAFFFMPMELQDGHVQQQQNGSTLLAPLSCSTTLMSFKQSHDNILNEIFPSL